MTAKDDTVKDGRAARDARLAAALRDNLRRRKAQGRGRAEAAPDAAHPQDDPDAPDDPSDAVQRPIA